jgi:hypothetical protein
MVDSTLPDKILGSFWGRFFVVILQTVLVSQLLLLTFLVRLYINITLLKYIVVLLVGLLAGFSTRRFLTGHTRILQLLAALISTALSLASLYILSAGFLGINLFYRSNTRPDWQGLIQFGFAALGALLVINAFRTQPAVEEPPLPAPRPQTSIPQPKPELKRWLPKLSLPSRKKVLTKFSGAVAEKSKPVSTQKPGVKKAAPALAIQKTNATPKKLSLAAAPTPKTRKPAKHKKKNLKPEIKFVGKEEHICPYCLDPVEDHDPRGVKICPICKTRHHADCWGITGACQIPHSH